MFALFYEYASADKQNTFVEVSGQNNVNTCLQRNSCTLDWCKYKKSTQYDGEKYSLRVFFAPNPKVVLRSTRDCIPIFK